MDRLELMSADDVALMGFSLKKIVKKAGKAVAKGTKVVAKGAKATALAPVKQTLNVAKAVKSGNIKKIVKAVAAPVLVPLKQTKAVAKAVAKGNIKQAVKVAAKTAVAPLSYTGPKKVVAKPVVKAVAKPAAKPVVKPAPKPVVQPVQAQTQEEYQEEPQEETQEETQEEYQEESQEEPQEESQEEPQEDYGNPDDTVEGEFHSLMGYELPVEIVGRIRPMSGETLMGFLGIKMPKIKIPSALKQVAKTIGPVVATVYPPAAPAIGIAMKVMKAADKGNKNAVASIASAIIAAKSGDESAKNLVEVFQVAKAVQGNVAATNTIKAAANGDPAAIKAVQTIKQNKNTSAKAAEMFDSLDKASAGQKSVVEIRASQAPAGSTIQQRAKEAGALLAKAQEILHSDI